ncbi:MAG TPA: hypothetical protein VFI88_07275 [Sphingomicrobium sp.]|nr:hypothetical protein [Sphingomicrobium sp.]
MARLDATPPPGAVQQANWWERPAVIAAVILLSTLPLLYPKIPPLVDLLGHMGRYRVQLDIDSSPWLHHYYGFHWAAIGNLGVDILVMPLAKLIGLEPAVKLIVLAIPPMTVGGFLWVAREVHGRIPPTAFFALPFVYGHPFLFGFANFALSMALAFLAFGLWLRLGRLGRTKLRAWLFVPISLVVFFCHTYGWGALGLMCFSAEAVRQHDKGVGWFRAGVYAALHASVMALPLLVMIIWRSETHGGGTADWFNWKLKWLWVEMALRDRWKAYDKACVFAALAVLVFAIVHPRLTLSRNLAFSGLVLVAGFIVIPRIVFGSAYADMRLAPYMIAVLLLAIRFRGEPTPRLGSALAILALGFFGIRIASTTVSLAMAADDQQAKLAALDHVPMGARVATLVGDPCGGTWPLPRNSHLGSMVIVRKQGFSNDQWVLEGVNLLDLHYTRAGHFSSDPSQRVRIAKCAYGPLWGMNEALEYLPREAFDYVWLIDPPPFDPDLTEGLKPIWRGPGSILYRIPK